MGFSLKQFFEELQELLASDMKPKNKHAALVKMVAQAKKYASECGQL